MKRLFMRSILGFVIVCGGLWASYSFFFACEPIPVQTPEAGAHGMRVWRGATVISFLHTDKPSCIPDGWTPLGETWYAFGRASFAVNSTGLVIKKDAFTSGTLTFSESSYHVTLTYPSATPASDLTSYKKIISDAFEKIGPLFEDSNKKPQHRYTILITAGLGTDDSEANAVYPDVLPHLSFVILKPNIQRSKEYVIHSVMHAYNRFRPDLDTYAEHQDPISRGGWQEAEAAWSEIRYNTDARERLVRAEYLYNVHTAVRTRDFSLIAEPPFDSKEDFMSIQGSLDPHNASFLDEQYGHYVLAPLVLLGIDGLLAERGINTSVVELLTEVHKTHENFFDLLKTPLPKSDYKDVLSWIAGKKTIPLPFIERALAEYERE